MDKKAIKNTSKKQKSKEQNEQYDHESLNKKEKSSIDEVTFNTFDIFMLLIGVLMRCFFCINVQEKRQPLLKIEPENTCKLQSGNKLFLINIKIDAISAALFVITLLTRFYKLDEPRNIV